MLGIICHAQVGAWENSYTLAAHSERSVGKVALFSYMKSRILATNGQFPEAVALAREARQLDPESLFMLQNQVLLEVDAGNLAEAERLCREHMQRAPDQLSPFYHYAIICVLQQRWTDAEAAIAEVLKRQAQRPRMTVSQKQGLAELQRRIEEGRNAQSQR
jgi:predicted Zn-dependent protease